MKMVFTGAFWGFVLVLAGLSILIKVFFNIDIPVFRVIFGIVFILIGISIISGKSFFPSHSSGNIVFDESEFRSVENESNVIFGKAVTDLSNIGKDRLSRPFEINTIFADNTVYLDPKTPVHIVVNSAFAGVILPDGNSTAFGTAHYRSPGFDKGKAHLQLEANVVFGSLKIRLKQ